MSCDYPKCKYNNQKFNSDDATKCVFHAEPGLKGVSESEFNRLIEQHAKTNSNYQGFIFPWFVDFSKSRRFAERADFSNCKFLGNKKETISSFSEQNLVDVSKDFCLSIRGMELPLGANFSNCIFASAVNFQSVQVEGKAFTFDGSLFKGDAHFEYLQIKSDLNFDLDHNTNKGVEFCGNVFFNQMSFHGYQKKITFQHVLCHMSLIFRDSKIDGCQLFNLNGIKVSGDRFDFSHIELSADQIQMTNSIFETSYNCFNFTKFRCIILSFENTIFGRYTTFEHCEFDGMISKWNSDHSFRNVKFVGVEVRFLKTIFNIGKVNFNNSVFNCNTKFIESEFLNGVYFGETRFTSEFNKIINSEVCIEFDNCIFKGDSIDFSNSEFSCKTFEINECEFLSNFNFTSNILISPMSLSFKNVKLQNDKIFKFYKPNILEENGDLLCFFESINFIPNMTIFDEINVPVIKDQLENKVAFIFRYCQLTDVFFMNSRMTLFSFYKSIFDKAIFISSFWNEERQKLFLKFHYKRENILFEDHLYGLITNQIRKFKNPLDLESFKNKFKLKDLNNCYEIAALYRRMKAALDSTKDYQQAGKFYFNEFEMLRVSLKGLKGFKYKSRLFLYNIYKVIAGYGERPFWTCMWFFVLWFLLSIIYLFIGFKFRANGIIYDILLSENGVKAFISFSWFGDFIKSIFFTLSRVLPSSYFALDKNDFGVINNFGFALSVFTSITMLILITLIGIGLKRHFRRF